MSQARVAEESREAERTGASSARESALPFTSMLALFALSGATGLVDQLCFSKYLAYVVGATAHAVSAVLAAFMTGLALGAHFGGKWCGRALRPLAAYGALELVVAVAVALTPLGFHALTPIYATLARSTPNSVLVLSALRWCTALALVVVPTFAMGATLPFLSRAIEASDPLDEQRRERRLSFLYAANTLGGASGALLAAYAVLPALGVAGTLEGSALASALVGLTAWLKARIPARASTKALSARRRAPSERVSVSDEFAAAHAAANDASADARTLEFEASNESAARSMLVPSRRERSLLAFLALASGALVFASEVVFTHLLALIIGNSAYAFGLILAAFLASLFVGASCASRARGLFADAALALGLAATSLVLLATLPLWDRLPELFATSGKSITSFQGREALRGGIALLILLAPTSLMGLTFPLLLLRVARHSGMGRAVGRLTAINTLGAVLGSLGAGYALLPALGSQRSLEAVGLGFGVSALVALAWARGAARVLTFVISGAAALLAAAAPRWDLNQLTSGANVYFEGQPPTQTLVSIREDVHGGVTTVGLNEGVYTLFTNGKFQGNTGWEMNAQRFFAHYPAIFVEHYDSALVIGLGTGTTLGTLATYPWRHIDVAEISPAIVDAARRYFQATNRGAIDDARVALTHADGRNFLLVSDAKYDLISMELSSIWFSGASSLYSREFYGLVASHLEARGVFQQWVQLHHIYKRDFATIVNTLRQSFRHVALFYGGGQGILVASAEPLATNEQKLRALEARPQLRELLPFGRPLEELTDDVLVLDAGLDAFLEDIARENNVARGELVSTDENLYLEYATPRGNVLPWSTREDLVAELRSYRDAAAVAALLRE